MFENYGTYLEILELASRLARNSIPYQLIPSVKEGWTLIIYESVGIQFGKRVYTLTVDDHSLGREKDEIEVIEEDYLEKNRKKYSLDQEDCFELIMRWYMDRYNKVVGD